MKRIEGQIRFLLDHPKVMPNGLKNRSTSSMFYAGILVPRIHAIAMHRDSATLGGGLTRFAVRLRGKRSVQ